jgi:hypothetical protein
MARIDHSFSMEKPPEVAQSMFVRDIAPELAKDRDFQIRHERPGELVFSDGAGPGEDVDPDIEETPQEQEDRDSVDFPLGRSVADEDATSPERGIELRGSNLDASLVSDGLDTLFARHVHVEFKADGAGTLVNIRGHLERDVEHALERLGTPNHWPETADLPHD